LKTIEEKAALYYLKQTQVICYPIPINTQHFTSDILFPGGHTPNRFIVCFSKADDVKGRKVSSPFDMRTRFFKKVAGERAKIWYLKSLSLSIDGKSVDPLANGEMGEYDATVQYFRFCKLMSADSAFFSTGITYDDFRKSYALFVYSLGATPVDVYGMQNATRTGTIRLELSFSAPSEYTIFLICMSEFPCSVSIDRKRSVKVSSL
jgi:hypothetical protein